MKTENMRYLVEASNFRSINAAAKHLFITQQQLSHIIRSLEEELGVQIFERTPKGIKLSREGEQVVTKMRQMLDLYDSMTHQKCVDSNMSGKLQVMAETNKWTSYARFYRFFLECHKGLDLHIRNMATETIIDAVANGEGVGLITRLIIDNKPDLEIPDELEFTPVGHDMAFVFGAVDNPVFEKRQSITLGALKDMPLMDFKPYMGQLSLTERLFRGMGKPNIRHEISDIRVFNELIGVSGCLFVAFRRPSYLPKSLNVEVREMPIRDKVIMETGVLKRRDDKGLADVFFRSYLDFYSKLYDVPYLS